MPDKLKVLVDLNLLMDVLKKREPFYESSANVLDLIEAGKVTGFVASHSLPTLFYLLKKNQTTEYAKAIITNILQILKVAPVDQSVIEHALILNYQDFEDAVQMMCAVQCKVDYLLTRNIKDFKPPLLPVLKPVEFLALMHPQ